MTSPASLVDSMYVTRFVALVVLLLGLTACSQLKPCPPAQERPDGSYVIAAPTRGQNVDGCEYEFEGGQLEVERDTDERPRRSHT